MQEWIRGGPADWEVERRANESST